MSKLDRVRERLEKHGGKWLAGVRNWINWNVPRGDTIPWASEELVTISMRQLQELGLAAAKGAVEDYEEFLRREEREKKFKESLGISKTQEEIIEENAQNLIEFLKGRNEGTQIGIEE